MKLKWTDKALSDLRHLYEFLAQGGKPNAIKAIQTLVQAPIVLLTNPHIGEQLFQFEPRDVRRIQIGGYKIRYEIQESIIYILRLWHP